MKLLLTFGILIVALMLTSFYKADVLNKVDDTSGMLPENVKPIIQRSCFDCHSKDAKNMFAKGKVNFDTLEELSAVKKVSALKDIQKEVINDKMPPGKYIKRYPEKKITEEEKEIINQWVNAELEAIKNNESKD